jgi:hypothetical protein
MVSKALSFAPSEVGMLLDYQRYGRRVAVSEKMGQ